MTVLFRGTKFKVMSMAVVERQCYVDEEKVTACYRPILQYSCA
jgi:hypothetical protein